MKTEEEMRADLRALHGHVFHCKCCGPHAYKYERELSTAMEVAQLPDQLASKIRGNLCKSGRLFLDAFLGVPGARP